MVTVTSCSELGSVWGELSRGRLTYRHTVFAEDCIRAYFDGADEGQAPGSAADLDRLRRLLLGASTKVVAISDQVAPSTVAVGARKALCRMGVPTSGAFSAPIVFAVTAAAHVKTAGVYVPVGRVMAGVVVEVVMPQPAPPTTTSLSSIERTFFRFACEGLPLSDMAKARSCSEQTAANILTAMYRKLGVGGRRELAALVAQLALGVEPETETER
jgi:DNA-binding CsgD family transcriptional regulator